jgi:methylated-DNA-[protein]-cysteine S-methyltransferase
MPWGLLYVEEQGDVLTRIQFLRPEEKRAVAVTAETPLLREACAQLSAYGEGKLRHFDLPLAPKGTDFQLRVWKELRRIEWGQTRSYGEVARAVDSPRGARAVGMACNRNPLLLVVPCHRVLGSDGSLVGFGEGIALKRLLLEHERVLIPLDN